MYGRFNLVKIFNLWQNLVDIWQASQTVATYNNKLLAIWNELDVVESPIISLPQTLRQVQILKGQEQLMRFLFGLNKGFIAFRTQILANDSELSLQLVYQLVIRDESQRMTGLNIGKSLSAFLASLPTID